MNWLTIKPIVVDSPSRATLLVWFCELQMARVTERLDWMNALLSGRVQQPPKPLDSEADHKLVYG